ncbi:MAG: DUF4492 domain-containing protein [Bacteroidales bacterium]
MKVGRIVRFYMEGFRNMPSWGRRVWLIIILKLFIMFAILKIFFFPDIFKRDFNSDSERSRFMLEELTNKE